MDIREGTHSCLCLQPGPRYGHFQLKGDKLKARRGERAVTIASVQEGQKVKEGYSREEVQIEFPQQFLFVDRVYVLFGFRLNRGRLVDLQLHFLFGHGGEEGGGESGGCGVNVGVDGGYLSWWGRTRCKCIVVRTECERALAGNL